MTRSSAQDRCAATCSTRSRRFLRSASCAAMCSPVRRLSATSRTASWSSARNKIQTPCRSSLRQGMKNSGPFRPGVFYGKTHGRTAHPSPNGCYTRYPDSQLRNGNLAAHRVDCLVLLGSPPDTVHRALLRKTRSSTPLIRVRRHSIHPRSGIPPRCSGLRVTGHRYLPK